MSRTLKKKAVTKRRPPQPMRVDTNELCKELVAMAAFVDSPHVQEKIYKAVRQLQLLDRLAGPWDGPLR
jgi:hypothetical protein